MVHRLRALNLIFLAAACGGAPSATAPSRAEPSAPAAPAPAPHAAANVGAAPSAPRAADAPPIAARRPHAVVSPNGTRDDPYYWLRDDTRKDPDVLAYLAAENSYTERARGAERATEATLFAEIRGRIQEEDQSVPTFEDGYWYYDRFETGKQHEIVARRKATMSAPEEIILDANQLAAGHSFYAVGTWQVSRNGALLAWIDDTVGRRQYTLHVKDLRTGAVLPDTAENVADLAWANDNRTLFVVGKDPVTLRTDRVLRKTLGAPALEPVFQEPDGSYYVGLDRTKSRRFVKIVLRATTNSEVRLIDADRPRAAPTVFLPRAKDHEYAIDHFDHRFWIRTNADAKNFRVVTVAEGKQGDRAAWRDVIPHDPAMFVERFSVVRGAVAATVRTGGLSKVRVVPDGKPAYFVAADDPTYAMSVINVPDHPDASAARIRYSYDSMIAPTSVYELDLRTGQRALRKRDPVPTYDPSLYTSEYVHARAADGTRIPISVVYKKSTPRDGTAPLLVYGYGSYGYSIDASLSLSAISLLDRGWVYAIAHVRGGQELGRAWYEDGKLLRKRNTFTDFIAASEHLVAERYAARDQVFAQGGSAGGLLMGAIVNLRPDLFRGVIAGVPFVDVVTTMLDESIPLTTNEFDEWGNPKHKDAYDYMLSYSPYDNVAAKPYPSIYVSTGLWDSQVQYFEPAKWVAKLRATKTDDNLLLLDTDMTSGHGGASGRFDRLKRTARELAFMLHVRARPDARGAR